MSMAPNNPFEQPPDDSHFGRPYPQQRGSNVWLWVLAAVGSIFLIGMVVCCGAGYFLVDAGKKMIADGAAQELRDNPIVQEHIGEIDEIEIDFGEVISNAQDQDEDDLSITFVFRVKGSKGSGKILMRQDDGDEAIASAQLVMDDGTQYELPLEENTEFMDEEKDEDVPVLPIQPVDTEVSIEEADSPLEETENQTGQDSKPLSPTK